MNLSREITIFVKERFIRNIYYIFEPITIGREWKLRRIAGGETCKKAAKRDLARRLGRETPPVVSREDSE
jgi:hypothetical protein